MNIKDIENKIEIIEEQQWDCQMSDSYDSDWFNELQVRLVKYRDILEMIDKANDLLELINKNRISAEFKERLKECLCGNFINDDEDLEV